MSDTAENNVPESILFTAVQKDRGTAKANKAQTLIQRENKRRYWFGKQCKSKNNSLVFLDLILQIWMANELTSRL